VVSGVHYAWVAARRVGTQTAKNGGAK